VGFSAGQLNLFNSEDGDDFVVRMDVVCDVSPTGQAAPNWHPLDSKSKRRFSVGDKLQWLFSLIRPVTTEFTVDLAVNARVLWKLKL